jgi:hypothetical protein
MATEKYDDVLLNLAGQHGGIEPLLKTFFSFLHRRTDYYVINREKEGKMGFAPGVAEKLMVKTFRGFPYKEASDVQKAMQQQQPGGAHSSRSKQTNPKAKTKSKASASSKAAKGSPAASPVPAPAPAPALAPEPKEADVHPLGTGKKMNYNDEGKQIPVGNGGVTPNYWWTQTLYETTIYVDVPQGTKGKDIKCDISKTGLKLGLKGAKELLIDGELPENIRADDSTWSVESNKQIVIVLDKVVQTWWKSVVKGDPEIDTQKVDSTMRVDEYDAETQGAIRKIMFDQRQKAQGLPTSDELNTEAMLERAKNLPGSPFLPPEMGGAPPDPPKPS